MSKQVESHLLTYWPLWLIVIIWLAISVYSFTTLNTQGSLLGDAVTNTRVMDKSDATREICKAGSGYTHEQCADVQSKFNTEYLCNADGRDCWVEVK